GRLNVETQLVSNHRRTDMERAVLPSRQPRRLSGFMPDQKTDNRHRDQCGGNCPLDEWRTERTADFYAGKNGFSQGGRHFGGAQFFGHGCIECYCLAEPAFQEWIASSLFERLGKAWVTRVLTSRPIRVQNKFRLPVIHVIPPFCLIGRRRLYSQVFLLLRPAADVTALCRVTTATSQCRSAHPARPRFPDTKTVRDKKVSAVRETALPLHPRPAVRSRCPKRSYLARSPSHPHARHPARPLENELHVVTDLRIRDTSW